MGASAFLDLELPELMTLGFDPRFRGSRSVRRLGVTDVRQRRGIDTVRDAGRVANLLAVSGR